MNQEEKLRRSGLVGLFVFSLLGFSLELLHAYKVAAYLDPENETRRLLFRLAHAHGTLLSIVLLVLSAHATTLAMRPGFSLGSGLVRASHVLLPVGFFLGGLGARGGDPSLLGALIPLGALTLTGGLLLLVRAAYSSKN